VAWDQQICFDGLKFSSRSEDALANAQQKMQASEMF
jgi:hypothetical protein